MQQNKRIRLLTMICLSLAASDLIHLASLFIPTHPIIAWAVIAACWTAIGVTLAIVTAAVLQVAWRASK